MPGAARHRYVAAAAALAMIASLTVALAQAAANPAHPWTSPERAFRLPLSVSVPVDRSDDVAVVTVDFTSAFAQALHPGRAFDPASLLVTEVDEAGTVLASPVAAQFEPAADYDAATRAVGELLVALDGATAGGSSRHFYAYFDEPGGGTTPPVFDPRVEVSSGALDEGDPSLLVDLGDSAWYFHELGGGFSSAVDAQGNDWIGYHPTGGAAGEYRGIPNLVYPEGHLHPGATTATTTITAAGPLRVTFRASTADGWAMRWHAYADRIEAVVEAAPHPYWFQYEGTPGGVLEPGSDLILRSDGATLSTDDKFTSDLPGPEWVAFADPAVGRSLWLAQHQDDAIIDHYRPMQNVMTVFGFGRDGINRGLTAVPQRFSLGLVDAVDHATVTTAVERGLLPPTVTLGTAESNVVDTTPPVIAAVAVDQTATDAVTVTWSTDEPADSTVSSGPSTAYEHGAVGDPALSFDHSLLVDGLACETEYHFQVGSTDASGNTAAAADSTFTTATCGFVVDATTTGPGAVEVSPELLTYPAGTVITLTAIADPGAVFDGWSGDVSDTDEVLTVTLTSDLAVSASFSSAPPTSPYRSDDFNTDPLHPAWSAIDPRGDATFTTSGAGSGEATMSIAVPGGIAHDAWKTNLAPRLMQPVADTDFRLEASFASEPTARYQMQGILVEADAGNWIRADSYHDGVTLRVFAARTTNGSSSAKLNVPVAAGAARYLRLERSGSMWTVGYSADGSTFTEAGSFSSALSPTTAGVFAGNAGAAPAHVAIVDYIFEVDHPIAVEDQPDDPTLLSDDFNAPVLDGRWSITDPIGDATVGVSGAGSGNAVLSVSLPGGVEHDAWNTNQSVRLTQVQSDVDFELEVGFGNQPTLRYQTMGVLVEQDSANWIRFDTFHDGTTQRLFAAVTSAGASSARINAAIAPGEAQAIRVHRSGDTWTLSSSPDGIVWATAGSFVHPAVVTRAGVFASNVSGGAPAPALDALFDYVFNTASPIVPEDGNAAPNHPVIVTVLGSGTVTRSPAATSFPAGTVVTLSANPAPGAEFVSWSGDRAGTDPVLSFTVSGPTSLTATFADLPPSPPEIDIWYGDTQTFGENGVPQRWINVVGNVSDEGSVVSLSYTLNGGTSHPLSMGHDKRRLWNVGDFNVEIDTADLVVGTNTVLVSAVDDEGATATRTVTVQYAPSTPSLPHVVDWSSASAIGDVAQVVDGKWEIVDGELRTVEVGYDRTIAIGDLSWGDFEVTMPFTIDAIGPDSGVPLSGPALIGVGMHWRGHTSLAAEQPRWYYWPTGAFAWYTLKNGGRYDLLGNLAHPADYRAGSVPIGVPHLLKARAEAVPGGVSYQFKIWPQAAAEPASWSNTIVEPDGPATGSLLLIAHHFDVRIGTVTVTALP
ncbi:MAG: DUF1349 domain-containing protein [Acidimicrobiia bacterium]|nr:DUF1349 domain-containing protein [Acidimicrobiia bacterium]